MQDILTTILFLQFSYHVSSTLFSDPHKLASLFKMEEKLLDLLNKAAGSGTSGSMRDYFISCIPRFRQLTIIGRIGIYKKTNRNRN